LAQSQCQIVTRSNTAAIEKNPVLEALERMEEAMREVDIAVIDSQTKSLYSAFKKVKLLPKQQSRRWDEACVPCAPNLDVCVMCNHCSTDLPIENDEMVAYNKKINEKYKEDTALWDAYLAKKSKNDPSAKKPEHLKSRPHRRAIKQPIVQCMCATSYCVFVLQDSSNHCPIKCRKICSNKNKEDKNTGSTSSCERYPFEGTPYPICTCPICMCKCQFACLIKDMPKLLNATWYVCETEATGKGNVSTGSTNQESIQQS